MTDTQIVRDADDLLDELDRRYIEVLGYRAFVESVSGTGIDRAVAVRAVDAITGGIELLPLWGETPAIGDTVVVVPLRGGRFIALSNRESPASQAVDPTTGAGSFPNLEVAGAPVQRQLRIWNSGALVYDNPWILNTRYGLQSSVGGTRIDLDVDFGTGTNQVPRGDHSHATRNPVMYGLQKTTITNLTSTSFTNLMEATVTVQAGVAYDWYITGQVIVTTAASATVEGQIYLGSNIGPTASHSISANTATLPLQQLYGGLSFGTTSVTFGARFRTTTGTSQIRQGVISLLGIPRGLGATT